MTTPETRLRAILAAHDLPPGAAQAIQRELRGGLEDAAAAICPRCREGVPHHTNAQGSIGGDDHRAPVYDLHISTGGGLEECVAYAIWVLRG